MSSSQTTAGPLRQKWLYWSEMLTLKGDALYIHLYRDSVGRWVTALGALKAIASCGGIAAWVIWREYAFVWGCIIALSQLADALKDVFPFAKRHKAASVHATTLDYLFNDVQLEWETILSERYTDEEIMERRHKLRKLQIDAEQHNFPEGLPEKGLLRKQARRSAEDYFATTYGVN